MKAGYYIDNKGNRVELFDERIGLSEMNLVELILPDNCIWCDCSTNELTSLIIPESCFYYDCSFNNLDTLIVNSKCKKLFCYDNFLTELILPESCIRCDCEANKLTKLIVNSSCKELYCYNNELTELILPENCGVRCINNKFSPYIVNLISMDRKLSNQIFMMEECKLKSMLLSSDEETFELGFEILKNIKQWDTI